MKKTFLLWVFLPFFLVVFSGCSGINTQFLSGNVSVDLTEEKSEESQSKKDLPVTAGKEFSHSDGMINEPSFFSSELLVDSPKISLEESLEDPVSDTLVFQNTKTFGLVSTTVSLTQTNGFFEGVLAFDKVYAQEFYNEDDQLNELEIENMIKQNLFLVSSGGECTKNVSYIDRSEEEEVTGMFESLNFILQFTCNDEAAAFGFKNTLFVEKGDKFAHVFDLKKRFGPNTWSVANKVLTNKIPLFQYGTEGAFKKIDTDGDGLFDDEEKIYGTDPYVIDTDQDGLSDSQEILRGTNPTVPE